MAPRRFGTAAVEFAIVAPLFLLFIFGVVEFGRVMLAKNVVTNASREAARVAIIDGATSTQVTQVANDYCAASSMDVVEVLISPSDLSTATPDTPITVTVRVDFDDVTFFSSSTILKNLSFSGSTTMRKERF